MIIMMKISLCMIIMEAVMIMMIIVILDDINGGDCDYDDNYHFRS